VESATNILEQSGFTVDYYPSEKVTVEFYRKLPLDGYDVIILRVHSASTALKEGEYVKTPVSLFTSENYSYTKYIWEQLTDQLVMASRMMPEPPYYFAITPKFVTSSIKGKFQNSIIIMMGCEGLEDSSMAKAFVERGARVYIGWSGSVLASHTDIAVMRLLQHLILERQPVKKAVKNAMREIGPDPTYKSVMVYYPLEAGNYKI
jgi:hypothetical protein